MALPLERFAVGFLVQQLVRRVATDVDQRTQHIDSLGDGGEGRDGVVALERARADGRALGVHDLGVVGNQAADALD